MAQDVVKNPNLNVAEIGAQDETSATQQTAEATAAVSQESTGEVGGQVLLFFHPDHLGSTSYVTDDKGKIFEHLQYFPFGETWVEQTSSKQRTPNWFTAKELDEDTGLYYFGARYYDPRTSMWISADPAMDKFLPNLQDRLAAQRQNQQYKPEQSLPGLGGVYNSKNLGMYTYSQLNPVRLVDPDGKLTNVERSLNREASIAFIDKVKENLSSGEGTMEIDFGEILKSLGIPEAIADDVAKKRGPLQLTIKSKSEGSITNTGEKLSQKIGKIPGTALTLDKKFKADISLTKEGVTIENIEGLGIDILFFGNEINDLAVKPGSVLINKVEINDEFND